MGKKIAVLSVVLFCILLLIVSGIGENSLPGSTPESALPDGWTLVYIPQVQISLAVPPDYEIITQDTTESRFFTKEDLDILAASHFENNTYLYALSYGIVCDLTLSVSESYISSTAEISKEAYEENFMKKTKPVMEQEGYEVYEHEILTDGDMQYVSASARNNDGFYILNFGTVVDYQSIWIGMSIFGREPTQEDVDLFDQIRRYSVFSKNGTETVTSWICPNCGQELTTNFCPECGAKKTE